MSRSAISARMPGSGLCPLETDVLAYMNRRSTIGSTQCAAEVGVSSATALAALLHLAALGLVEEWTAIGGGRVRPTGTFTISPRGRLIAHLRAPECSDSAPGGGPA